jgi:S-adenosylmethionine-diacylgycerolhomoserine-N-methlytransferase
VGLLSDLKILYHMSFQPIRGNTHQERLDSFYSGQAQGYDEFRRRLLNGREPLYRKLASSQPRVWVDLGGGTGSNLEAVGKQIPSMEKVYLVDLSRSLLSVARERGEHRGWKNLQTIEADVTTWLPPAGPGTADVVTFSYSLTMIPDWFAAIDQAMRILKPGGRIGVVDFYVARKHAPEGFRRHSWLKRTFWPNWFAMDNVFPSADHVPYLHHHFEREFFSERFGSVPYMIGSEMPHYLFIGRKKGTAGNG